MFSHIMLGATDIEASKKFYDAILAELGYAEGVLNPNAAGHKRYFWFSAEGGVFSISQPIDDAPATGGNGSTIGFAVKDETAGDRWHAAGLAHGGKAIEDPPGVRNGPDGKPAMYLAYLRDPSGNKICALKRV